MVNFPLTFHKTRGKGHKLLTLQSSWKSKGFSEIQHYDRLEFLGDRQLHRKDLDENQILIGNHVGVKVTNNPFMNGPILFSESRWL